MWDQPWPSCCEAVHHQWCPETTRLRRKHLMKRWFGASEAVNVKERFTCGCGTRWGGWWQSRGSSKPRGGCRKAARVFECGAPTLQPDEGQRDERIGQSAVVYTWLLLQGASWSQTQRSWGKEQVPDQLQGLIWQCQSLHYHVAHDRRAVLWRSHLELLRILQSILDPRIVGEFCIFSIKQNNEPRK